MQIHNLKRPEQNKTKKRVGRGGKRGTYSGRGCKGQKARSGGNITPGFEGQDTTLVGRSPKIQGFTSPKMANIPLSLSLLDKHFAAGETVSLKTLTEKGLIKINKRSRARHSAKVKILATGKLTKKLQFEDCLMSQKAKEAIEKI